MSSVALFPNGARITQTHFSDGLIVTGRNLEGYGGRGIFISGKDIEPEFRFVKDFVDEGELFIDVGTRRSGRHTFVACRLTSVFGLNRRNYRLYFDTTLVDWRGLVTLPHATLETTRKVTFPPGGPRDACNEFKTSNIGLKI